MKFFTFVGLSALIVSITSAAVPSSTPISGKTINVTTQSLCIFMPKTPGELIASSEPTAVAFCNNTSAAPGAKKIPAGFIKSSHFVSGTGQGKYVQYTGTIDPTKYSLKSKDGGGQYDNHGSLNPMSKDSVFVAVMFIKTVTQADHSMVAPELYPATIHKSLVYT
ncbi:unnamed protein product [Umbelopsis vinacea]